MSRTEAGESSRLLTPAENQALGRRIKEGIGRDVTAVRAEAARGGNREAVAEAARLGRPASQATRRVSGPPVR